MQGDRIDKDVPVKENVLEIARSFQENPDKIVELLTFGSRFPNYSLNNTRMICHQNPGATYVQSYAAWKKEGYPVKRGEKGLLIIVPVKAKFIEKDGELVLLRRADAETLLRIKQGELPVQERIVSFGYGNVFDISQTTYPAKDYPQYYAMGFSDEQYDRFAALLERYTREQLDTIVQSKDLHSISVRGLNLIGRNEIRINDRLAGAERLSTLIHEIGHQMLHQQPDVHRERPVSQIEFEADAFAVMLQSYFDLPVTETRKRHLAQNYQKMYKEISDQCPTEELRVKAIDQILSEPYRQFSLAAKALTPYIREQYRPDIQQNVKEPVQEQFLPNKQRIRI